MKIKLFAAGVALCVLGMTGCNKDSMEDTYVPAGRQVTMEMQASGPQTRAGYTDDGDKMNFSWSDGDAISVVVNRVSGNGNCRLAASGSGKCVPFSGQVSGWAEGVKTIYAFYPYNSTSYAVIGGDTPAEATVLLTLPNPQTYTVGGAVSNSFMVGVGTATASGETVHAFAGMKQVMSFVNLNITQAPGKVKGVKLSCAEAVFPTTATVGLSTAEISASGTPVNELSMTVTDNTTGAAKTVSFAMFPADLSGKKIHVEVTFENGESKIIEKAGTNFVRNMHYVMGFDGAVVPATKPGPVGDVVLFAEGVSPESGWYDENKSWGKIFSVDSRMCWAFTETNMIQWWQDRYVASGHALPPGVPNGFVPGRENAPYRQLSIFEEFYKLKYKNVEREIFVGIPLYFTTYFPDLFPDTAPFFQKATYGRTFYIRDLKGFSDVVVNVFKDRGVLALEIPGHVVTLWGVTYNAETGLVKNLFTSDSDDVNDGEVYVGLWERRPIRVDPVYGNVLMGGHEITYVHVLYAYPGKID